MLGVPILATIEKCETCVLGKMTALPYPKQSKTCATKPLELIHLDVLYVLTPESIRGEKYVCTFIDDFSRFGITYLLKNRSEVIDKFRDYKVLVENFFNTKIKSIRNDRGG